MVFKIFPKLFTTLYNNFLIASLKLITNFENTYSNPPQNSLLCDWSIFSNAELSLAAGESKQELACHRRLSVLF
jgi:hypothetical protein